jgi:hypothetical protein
MQRKAASDLPRSGGEINYVLTGMLCCHMQHKYNTLNGACQTYPIAPMGAIDVI